MRPIVILLDRTHMLPEPLRQGHARPDLRKTSPGLTDNAAAGIGFSSYFKPSGGST